VDPPVRGVGEELVGRLLAGAGQGRQAEPLERGHEQERRLRVALEAVLADARRRQQGVQEEQVAAGRAQDPGDVLGPLPERAPGELRPEVGRLEVDDARAVPAEP
jgi:hypothetical protein